MVAAGGQEQAFEGGCALRGSHRRALEKLFKRHVAGHLRELRRRHGWATDFDLEAGSQAQLALDGENAANQKDHEHDEQEAGDSKISNGVVWHV